MLGLGRTGHPYLERAHARGLAVSIVDRPSLLRAESTQRLLRDEDRCYPVPRSSDEATYAAASETLRDAPADAVLAVSEPHVVPAALLAEDLGLPGPGLHAAVVSRNKLFQRRLLGRHGVSQPAFWLAHGTGDAARWAYGRYPVLLKPLTESGSMGVRVVDARDELADWCTQRAGTGPFLVEELVTGPEYSLECVVRQRRLVFASLTAKTTTDPPYCVEIEHLVPAPVDGDALALARRLGQQVLAAAGVDTGLVHLEFRLGAHGPAVIEFAVRGPGDHIMDLVREATGADLHDAAVALAAGEQVAFPCTTVAVAAVWFPAPPPGRVTAVDGLETVAAMPSVLSAQVDVRSGDTVLPLRSSLDRVGYVVLRADTMAGVRDALDRVRHSLVIHTDGAGT